MKIDCKIEIKGNKAFISGVYPVEVVKEVTSYPVEGAFFSPAYRRGTWDGRKHLFSKKTGSFPAGLTHVVVEAIKVCQVDARVEVVDRREENVPEIAEAGFDLPGLTNFGKNNYWYQLDCAKAMAKNRRGIIKLATNSGKSSVSCSLIKHLNVPTLYLVPDVSLLYQVRKQFAGYLNIPEFSEFFGVIGDGELQFGELVTIATPQTVYSRMGKDSYESKRLQDYLENQWQMLIADECHKFGSETFSDVMDTCNAYYRYGTSGSPLDRSDGANLRLIAQTGPVIYEVSNKTLVELGVSVQPYLELVPVNEPNLKGKDWPTAQDLGVVNNDILNKAVADKVNQEVQLGKQVVIIFDRIDQGNHICKYLDQCNLTYQYLKGADNAEEREKCFDKFRKGKLNCILGTKILNQGIDIDCIDVLILPGGGKAKISSLQRIGRGLRKKEGKDSLLVVDYMISCNNKHLAKHSKERLTTYKKEDVFVMVSAK